MDTVGRPLTLGDCSPCHRTTVAHFLNQGRWDDARLEDILKGSVVRAVYGEALRSGSPVSCIVDDTIASKTKPASRALHPIEDAYFHQSHLKRRQDYGQDDRMALTETTISYSETKIFDKYFDQLFHREYSPENAPYHQCMRFQLYSARSIR